MSVSWYSSVTVPSPFGGRNAWADAVLGVKPKASAVIPNRLQSLCRFSDMFPPRSRLSSSLETCLHFLIDAFEITGRVIRRLELLLLIGKHRRLFGCQNLHYGPLRWSR